MTTWVPLTEAFDHVLLRERDRWVTERLLLRALYDGSVRARGYVVDQYCENAVEPLMRTWFGIDDEQHVSTKLNTEANSVRHQDGWSDVDVTVRRLELAWEDLVKVWPERAQVGLRRGRKRQFDYDQILREADADVAENGRPRSLKEWCARVAERLEDAGERVPRHTLMMELLGPKYRSFR